MLTKLTVERITGVLFLVIIPVSIATAAFDSGVDTRVDYFRGSHPEKGYYYRSDHFNFAKRGVPALYLTRSTDSVEHGKAWGQNQLDAYTANDYHKPSDEYSPDWDLSGAAENVLLFFGIADSLANSRDWPNWNPGTEFKSKRDESNASRVE